MGQKEGIVKEVKKRVRGNRKKRKGKWGGVSERKKIGLNENSKPFPREDDKGTINKVA